jgi:hypothetical protein
MSPKPNGSNRAERTRESQRLSSIEADIKQLREEKQSQISTGDKVLWFLAAAMALTLVLLAPKLSANLTGRIIAAVLLVSLFLCILHPILQIPIIKRTSIRQAFGVVIAACAVGLLGWFVWPPTLVITPRSVTFGTLNSRFAINETYRFRMNNNTDDDVYTAEFDLIVGDPAASGTEFSLDIPTSSRKPFDSGGIGAEHFADMTGFLCRDLTGRPIYILSIPHLSPHESREIKVVRAVGATHKIEISSATGFFTTEPQARTINGNEIGFPFRFSAQVVSGGCPPFGFMVDEKEHKGMYWFNRKDGRL